MGEKSQKNVIKQRILLKFLAKIHNFSAVLIEWDNFSHEILSQNYPCGPNCQFDGIVM